MSDDLSYPIGKWRPEALDETTRRERIAAIAAAPGELRRAIAGLSDEQLDTPYRPGGWTVRQVAHHLADSHMNAFIRLRLALTEEEPTIKPYDQARWALLADAALPVEVSLTLLEALHHRWIVLLEALAPAEFGRRFRHPEMDRVLTVDDLVSIYAWHGRHHVAHVTGLRARLGWH
jgi:hypothetical protein